MVDINRLLQSTAAGQMAKKLDAADGNSDGKIKGSIWNQFVQGTGGKEISAEGSISIENAMKSITTYVVKNMKAQNKGESEIVEDYNTKINNLDGETSQAEGAEEAANEESSSDAVAANGTQGVDKKGTPKTAEQNIKVTVPVAYITKEVKSIIANKNQGLKLRASLKKGILKGVNKDNVAWATWGVSYGADTQKQAIKVYASLKKKYESYWPGDKKQPYVREFMKMSYIEQNNIIHIMADAVRKADNGTIVQAKKDKDYHNTNRKKIQQTFDNANKTLIDAANNKTSLKISKGDAWKEAELPDGRCIQVNYDNNGKIDKILISFDKTPDHSSDGTTYDGYEIMYEKDRAWYDIDKSNDTFEGRITSGYDFEKLKAIAESIFGE